jgi:transcriptional regulator with XRE-family HTH domain
MRMAPIHRPLATVESDGLDGIHRLHKIIFGKTIRALRHKRGMTLAKLAKLAHIHPSYAADVERGERNLSLLNILKLAAALRVHPGKLFVQFRLPESDCLSAEVREVFGLL